MSTTKTLSEDKIAYLKLNAPSYGAVDEALLIIDQLTAERDEWQATARGWRSTAESTEAKLASVERTKQHLLWAIDRANSEEDLARQAEAFERSRAEAAEHKIATALKWLDSGLTGEALAYHVAEALRAK